MYHGVKLLRKAKGNFYLTLVAPSAQRAGINRADGAPLTVSASFYKYIKLKLQRSKEFQNRHWIQWKPIVELHTV